MDDCSNGQVVVHSEDIGIVNRRFSGVFPEELNSAHQESRIGAIVINHGSHCVNEVHAVRRVVGAVATRQRSQLNQRKLHGVAHEDRFHCIVRDVRKSEGNRAVAEVVDGVNSHQSVMTNATEHRVSVSDSHTLATFVDNADTSCSYIFNGSVSRNAIGIQLTNINLSRNGRNVFYSRSSTNANTVGESIRLRNTTVTVNNIYIRAVLIVALCSVRNVEVSLLVLSLSTRDYALNRELGIATITLDSLSSTSTCRIEGTVRARSIHAGT